MERKNYPANVRRYINCRNKIYLFVSYDMLLPSAHYAPLLMKQKSAAPLEFKQLFKLALYCQTQFKQAIQVEIELS